MQPQAQRIAVGLLSFALLLTVHHTSSAQAPSNPAPGTHFQLSDVTSRAIAGEEAVQAASGELVFRLRDLHPDALGSKTCDCQNSPSGTAPPSKKSGCRTCCNGCLLDWSKYPETIQPMARPGNFPAPNLKGPAYYSIWHVLTDQQLKGPPKSGHSPVAINFWPFFDSDWRFVDEIPWQERNFVEKLKRIHLNDCWLMSTGGQLWTRYHHENNSRLTELQNDFLLTHVRTYADLWYSDWLRIYGEYVWADVFGEELSPLPFDVDRSDILNLFVDLKLTDAGDAPVYVRGGLQEISYGSQRLITALPWANKRHTFQGVKLFRHGKKWDFDAFWLQFVPADASRFNSPDENQQLAGSWLTYHPKKGELVDLYYLMYDNDNRLQQNGLNRAPFTRHTIGSRWA
ncbi:MAG TPA: hypothetical protein DDW52_01265, partial [Planctomycetaceae bacterium]|nr:hypothetical protein [Planctomycetaceae bacterium]